jgi:hypothetical protein
MEKSMEPGGGGRFESLAEKVHSPALAGWIGRKKCGPTKMAAFSAQGRHRAAAKRKSYSAPSKRGGMTHR